MLKRICIVAALLLLLVPLFAKSNEVYFKFQVSSKEEVNKISRLISISKIVENTIYAYANQKELSVFNQYGYSYTILQHPSKLREPVMADSKEKMRGWDSYPTYETYVDMMYQFAIDHPDICSVSSIGQSIEGRDILVAKISDNPGIAEDEPEFFYTGQMHGNELVTFIMLLRLIDHLLENYGSDDRITNIVNNIEIHINPLANPDGTYAGGNGTVWGATRNNANSIDLNRNFPDPEDGPHPDGNEWQPENIIMMDFADEHNFVLSSNFHSGVEVLNYPWDTWQHLTADDDWWQHVCRTYADTVHIHAPANYMTDFNNGITNGFAWYSISGGRQDYMNYFHRCREMTLELSDEMLLPESELEAHWEYNRQSFLLYMEECLYGIRGIVTNSSGEPINAEIKMLCYDIDNSEVYTDPEIGNYHRMLFPNIYNVRFSAYGYISQTIHHVQVVDNDIVIQNIQLMDSPQYTVTGLVISGNSNDPLPDVTVELLNVPIEAVLTNAEGIYQISDVYEGVYSAYISVEGYSSVLQEINVFEGSTEFDFVVYQSEVESFENGNFEDFSWSFEGDENWVIDDVLAYDGNYSARSGDISNYQETSLIVNMDVTASGSISYFYKVSSEQGFDFLKFYIDGNQMDVWSGEIDWSQQHYPISPGEHSFQWTYMKDANVSGGDDCAWIDLISFPSTCGSFSSPILQPLSVSLQGNYPNPFNPATTISFTISSNDEIYTSLEIFNVKGQFVKTLISEPLSSGSYKIVWNGKNEKNENVASGLYFYKLKTKGFCTSGKMLMLK